MEKFQDYILQEKVEDARGHVKYIGRKEFDQALYVVKILRTSSPSLSKIAKFQKEHELLKELNLKGVIKIHDILRENDTYSLIEENFQGLSLKEFLKSQEISLRTFLDLAVSLSQVLGDLHQKNIVHRCLTPSNILIDPKTKDIRVHSFGTEKDLTGENENIFQEQVIEDYLPYISPEQSGRMHRTVDYRSDIYSLGIIFYEMLSRKKPFTSNDPIELLHAHIAKKPENLKKIAASVPSILCAIISKMIAKTPKERYQNSWGLSVDLKKCRDDLEAYREIKDFSIAQQDISLKFRIPHILLGRDNEIKELLSAFEKVITGGKNVTFISGQPGIGKSTLVDEYQKATLRNKTYFTQGKYDQFKNKIPYNAITQAFNHLFRQILSESRTQIETWQKELTDALGSNARVITEVIPALDLIIGKQSPIPELNPDETKQRLELIFENLFKVFATKEHPLIFFLDDVQWIDSASIQLLKRIIPDPRLKYIHLIAAYRSIDCAGPDLLKEILQTKVDTQTIRLVPLKADDINQYVSKIVNCLNQETLELAQIIHQKTGGNPFAVNQLIKTLHENQYIRPTKSQQWEWDIEKIRDMKITDNVVDFMAHKISKLKNDTIKLLKICSCLGNPFDPEILAILNEENIKKTLSTLSDAIEEGMVSTQDDAYVFSHDRIQEAAYSLLSQENKQQLHYQIGKLLLKRTSDEKLKSRIFTITNQLNAAIEIIDSPREKKELSQLNLTAGLRAKSTSAFEEAKNYFDKGIRLLPDNAWKNQYDLILSLYIESGETEYILGNQEKGDYLLNSVLDNAQTVYEKIKVYEIKIARQSMLFNLKEAIQLGWKALEILNYKIPQKSSKIRILLEIIKAKIFLFGKKPQDLIDQPLNNDKRIQDICRILLAIGLPSYHHDPLYAAFISLRILNISNKYGLSIYSPNAYSLYGVVISSELNQFDEGYSFGKLALELCEKLKAPTQNVIECRFYFTDFLRFWKDHLRESVKNLLEGYLFALENGNTRYAAFFLVHHLFYSFSLGENLNDLKEKCLSYKIPMQRLHQPLVEPALDLWIQFIHCLKSPNSEHTSLQGEYFDKEKIVEGWIKDENVSVMAIYYTAEMILNYFKSDYKKSIEYAGKAQENIDGIRNMYLIAEVNFYQSLALLADISSGQRAKKYFHLKQVRKNQKQMKIWSKHAPENFLQKFHLIEAEVAVLKHAPQKAVSHFEKAIKLSQKCGFIQDYAIANERLSLFWLQKNNTHLGGSYLLNAYDAYLKWGARIKSEQIKEKYETLLDELMAQQDQRISAKTTTEEIGLRTLSKSLRAIAEEKIHRRMVEKVIQIALEFAGAQRGVLILRHESPKKDSEENLFVEAEGSLDSDKITMMQSTPMELMGNLSQTIVNFVKRTKENIVIHDALSTQSKIPLLQSEPYIKNNAIKSILCLPITTGSHESTELIGILYLENNLATYSFTEDRIETLEIICLSVAGRIELSKKAVTDGLTNLYNHEYFQNILQQEILISDRQEHKLSLILFDIDHFKNFNDRFGHQVGDLVLKKVAQTLKDTCRESDIVARYGGEEFAVLLRETSADNAVLVAQKMRKAIEELQIKNMTGAEEPLKVTISAGIAGFPQHSKEKEPLIKKADDALYLSKEKGRNQVTLSS